MQLHFRHGRPPTKASMTRSLMMWHQWLTSSDMLRTGGNQGASIEHGTTRKRCLNWLVTYSSRNMGKARGRKLEGAVKIHNSTVCNMTWHNHWSCKWTLAQNLALHKGTWSDGLQQVVSATRNVSTMVSHLSYDRWQRYTHVLHIPTQAWKTKVVSDT